MRVALSGLSAVCELQWHNTLAQAVLHQSHVQRVPGAPMIAGRLLVRRDWSLFRAHVSCPLCHRPLCRPHWYQQSLFLLLLGDVLEQPQAVHAEDRHHARRPDEGRGRHSREQWLAGDNPEACVDNGDHDAQSDDHYVCRAAPPEPRVSSELPEEQ